MKLCFTKLNNCCGYSRKFLLTDPLLQDLRMYSVTKNQMALRTQLLIFKTMSFCKMKTQLVFLSSRMLINRFCNSTF